MTGIPKLLNFQGEPNGVGRSVAEKQPSNPPVSAVNPYGQDSPPDIMEMILPDGSQFGLFNDPYAKQIFLKDFEGRRNGQFWLHEKINGGDFSDREIKLLNFLSTVRVATRSQIHRILSPNDDDERKTLAFLKKCRKCGIICTFSWISPLQYDRKKPNIYALTQVGAEAAEIIFQKKISHKMWLKPIDFPQGKNPSMDTFFLDLIGSELYCELTRIDRLIEWNRRPSISIPNSNIPHSLYASIKVIKDLNDFKMYWIEVFRPTNDWVNKVINRFKRSELAFNSIPMHQKPTKMIMLVDGDSRVKYLAELARTYMPSLEMRFITDERILSGIGPDTIINYNFEINELIRIVIPYFQEGYRGMTASEYFSSLQSNLDDEDEYEE